MRSTRFAAYAVIAGALAAPVLAAVPASAATAPTSSAYGISGTGLLNIPAAPAVSSAATPHARNMVKLPKNALIAPFSVATVKAAGNHSSASIADLGILTPKVTPPSGAPKLPKGLVFAKVVAARCDNGTGGSRIAQLQIADKKIKAGASPNTSVNVSLLNLGQVTATINKQVHNSDGTLTVTAVELNIALAGKTETIDISSATCGGGSATANPIPGSGSTTSPAAPTTPAAPTSGGEAPAPTPVKSDLPVTG